MKPRRQFNPLWIQLAFLLTSVALVTLIGSYFIFEWYWSSVLTEVPLETRVQIEQIRPSLRTFLDFGQWRLRPGLATLVFAALVIAVFSVLVSRRLLAPISALENAVERISRGQIQNQPKRFLDLKEQIEAIAQRLEQSEDARRIANAAIAHELRTPLSALRARVESLEYGVYPLEINEISKLHPVLDLLEHLTLDLQTLSFAEHNQLRLECQPINLSALLHEVCADTERAEDIKVFANQTPILNLDPKRIRQVLYNLLENVRRYTTRGCPIEIRLETRPSQVLISIADAGNGVPDEELLRLFTPFYRVEPSRSREYGGSGLGLAVVSAIITAHGGTVSAQRAALGGLEIQIELPTRV